VQEGNYVSISVEDTGTGITADALPHIFDPYFSTKVTTFQKGLGLGLSVCYSIVKNHDGYITVESTVGKGSIFRIYLPVLIGEELTKKALQVENEQAAKGKILLMDDDATILKTAAQLLERQGYHVETAAGGLEAVELYKKAKELGHAFDLVILDLIVPGGFGGVMTMRRLMAFDPHVKAIAISGYTDDPIIRDYRQYGFLGALTKPFRKDELQNILENSI
jgi:CheY-like chemotaxis protein